MTFPVSALLIVVYLLAGISPAHSRRAVSRSEVMETVVGARGAQHHDVDDTDEWGDDDPLQDEILPSASSYEEGDDAATGGGGTTVSSDMGGGNGGSVDGFSTAADGGAVEGPVPYSVRDRQLVTTDVSASSILREHRAWHSEEAITRFGGEILGYVTPWNGRGYDFARTFRSKFSYVSPVWYQLRGVSVGEADDKASFSLTGGHDFDEAWVSDVRDGVRAEAGEGEGEGGGETHRTKIVPRVVLEMHGVFKLSGDDLLEMAALLVDEAVLRGYHGYVLDVPLLDGIEEFLAGIVHTARESGMELLLIQSVRPGVTLSPRHLEGLVPLVHRLSLMTYDYGGGSRGGERRQGVPNSPLPWVRQCVEALAPDGLGSELREKILLGLPFYGYDNGRAISYHDAVSIFEGEQTREGPDNNDNSEVDRSPAVSWNPVSREHVISYSGRDLVEHLGTYPTLAFIQERVEVARELGVGLAVWELGQGMPYFFDLL